MQQALIVDNSRIAAVVGLDLSDKKSWPRRLEIDGQVSLDRAVSSSRAALRRCLGEQPRRRVVSAAGAQSHWIRLSLDELAHEVIVANPRRLKLLSEALSKNDRRDARQSAEFGFTCPKLRAPTEPRSEQTLVERCVLVSRQALLRARTQLINSVRGQLKIFGLRVAKGGCGDVRRARSPELRGSKQGDRLLRGLLVQCAQYILGPCGADRASRRWGLKLAEGGGQNAKKRAIVATARKLAVLLHVLWSRSEAYDPLHGVAPPAATA